MTWDELWKAYFYELPAQEANLWEEELKTKFNVQPPAGEKFTLEIMSAVRVIAEKQRQGALKHRPTLNHLISALIKGRYDQRVQREGGPLPTTTQNSCSLCGNIGWMPYLIWIDHLTGARSFGSRFQPHPGKAEYDETCPCLCSKGLKNLQNYYKSENHEKMIAFAYSVKNHLMSQN